ncbi:MAG TPA: hypothetical protein VK776_06540 [Bryobacteraceae bacterium]|nr:hypothetical protein [Bryobacteraceae bacterium]
MTVRFLKLMLLFSSLLAFTVALNAQSEVVTVHIPFAFEAAGKTLPAGDYRVDRGEASSVLVMQDGHGDSAAFLTMAVDRGKQSDGAALVFERHGSALVLSAVRSGNDQVRVLYGSDMRPGHAALKSTALAAPVRH